MTSQQISNLNNKVNQLQIQLSNLESKEALDFYTLSSRITNLESVTPSKITSIYSTDWYQIDTPSGLTNLFISLCGAGGAGGPGAVDGIVFQGGGGGGSGESISRYPINLYGAPSIIRAKCGAGGSAIHSNGMPSMVEVWVYKDFNQIVRLEASGGLGSTNINGGQGAVSSILPIYNGQNGQNGDAILPSFGNTFGGAGGNTVFGKGGRGGNRYTIKNEYNIDVLQQNGEVGTNGGGGGGSVPGSSVISRGGNGFVMIEWS